MTSAHIHGGTSTGSKRREAFLGTLAPNGFPSAISHARGARVWDEHEREYLDYVMGLGAVTLGYAYPEVVQAAQAAVADGVTGPLPPVDEHRLAELLTDVFPWMEQVRFLKTGAEATAAAVRIARTATGRDRVVTCGYHGWLDWCRDDAGVPNAVKALTEAIPFGDHAAARNALRHGAPPAAVVIEPVIDREPDPAWLGLLREECSATGTILIFDEIKTAFRIALGGASERYRVIPDLTVLGKGLANGFPLAAVGGERSIMKSLDRTWISSTLATESVALRAAHATVLVSRRDDVPGRLHRLGTHLFEGLERLCESHRALDATVLGIPEMCYLSFALDETAWRLTRWASTQGVIWKPTAYNFVSLAHSIGDIDRTLGVLEAGLSEASMQHND